MAFQSKSFWSTFLPGIALGLLGLVSVADAQQAAAKANGPIQVLISVMTATINRASDSRSWLLRWLLAVSS